MGGRGRTRIDERPRGNSAVGGPIPGFDQAQPAAGPGHGRVEGSPARRVALTGLVVIGAVALTMATVGGARPADTSPWAGARDDPAPDGGPSDGDDPTRDVALDATRAFARAAFALEEAGSFAYEGTVEATLPSVVRPGVVLIGEVAIEGTVALPYRSLERAESATVTIETLISGRGVWVRDGPVAGGGNATEWTLAAEGSPRLGLTGVADWLMQARDRRPGPTGPDGEPTFIATIDEASLETFAPGATSGELTLTVGRDGAPRHLAASLVIDEQVFELDVALGELGEPVDITAPGGRELGISPELTGNDLAAAGIVAPVQLTELPEGWIMYFQDLVEFEIGGGCQQLELSYADAATLDEYISLDISNADCVTLLPITPDRDLGNGWSAQVRDGSWVSASDGTTRVDVSSSLPVDEVIGWLTSLGPYDRLVQPYLTATEAGASWG